MLELNTVYKRGGKTFVFLFTRYAWWLSLLGLGCMFASYEIYFDSWNTPMANFLSAHPDWYIDTSMVSLWIFLLGFSLVFIGYLRARVIFGKYRFLLDDHSFHLKEGLLFIRETTIPYKQINNVHIGRPYHYRMMGLAQLDIVTASDKSLTHRNAKSKNFLIPLIDASLAKILSKQLIEYASRVRDGQDIEDENEDDDFDGYDGEIEE